MIDEKKEKKTVTVYATTLVHEDGETYQAGDKMKVSEARADKLIACGIASYDKPAPPAPPEELAEKMEQAEKDKMLRGAANK